MSEASRASVALGEVDPAGSRHLGRRSDVLVGPEVVIAGTAEGTVIAHDPPLEERWRSEGSGSVVSTAVFAGGVAVGERSPSGEIRMHDAETGTIRWRYSSADDVGRPQRESRFFLPFVVDVQAAGERLYAAARRYERNGDARAFISVIYAFNADGSIAWRYTTDASPISLDVRDDWIAVAYNRCPSDHQCGLIVLDTDTGRERFTWDPGTGGQRRVGDVALTDDGVAVASHGDYRGWLLDDRGGERWRVDLATPRTTGGETVYAYPNHVHAIDAGIAFVTGNTYPEEGRQTDVRHPFEHTVFGYTADGERAWTDSVGGFASEIANDGPLVGVPGAQNFRDRDPAAHALRVFDVTDGRRMGHRTEGITTAASLEGKRFAVIEEPVAYHDEGETRGQYRLHVGELS